MIQFFDRLSQNRASDAFSMVSDNLKWWAPTEVLLNVTKRSMMGRLDEATKQGTKFDMMELVSGASKVAAKASCYGGLLSILKNDHRFRFVCRKRSPRSCSFCLFLMTRMSLSR